MQKTFNVWIKRNGAYKDEFIVCSKMIELSFKLTKISADDDMIDDAAEIRGCDVSQWLETTFDMKDKVKSFKLTLKEN